jgi:hypothetical protein
LTKEPKTYVRKQAVSSTIGVGKTGYSQMED